MRDYIILALLLMGCVWTLRSPWIGAIMWTVVSLGSPHVAFGYASADWQVATAVAVCTLLAMLVNREKANPVVGAASWVLLLLVLWECITLPFSFDLDRSLGLWERSMKIYLMLFVTMSLLDTRKKLEVFIWAIALSIGYFGFKGGLFTLATGGNYRIWGPGGFIGGNNELALALIMSVPLMRYLQTRVTRRWLRWGLTMGMVLSIIAAVGTYSRGALLGVSAMSLFMVWRSDRKLLWGIGLVLLAVIFLSSMPDSWWNRMDTMRTYDKDESAQGRLNAWITAYNIAKDRVFGGGFMVALPWVFQKYSPNPNQVLVAHSVYFQMLGEHGFIGLFLFLMVGALTWFTAGSLRSTGRQHPDLRWAVDLGSMIQVSMLGFCITGAFLSLAYFDLPYNLLAIAVLGRQFARRELAALKPANPPAPVSPWARSPAAAPAPVSPKQVPPAAPLTGLR